MLACAPAALGGYIIGKFTSETTSDGFNLTGTRALVLPNIGDVAGAAEIGYPRWLSTKRPKCLPRNATCSRCRAIFAT
jgi:hypothetical protein